MSEFVQVNFDFNPEYRRIIDEMKVAMGDVVDRVVAVAKNYAPVSPTQGELDEEYERRRGSGKLKRRRATVRFRKRKNRPTPGGLEQSIEGAVDDRGGCIYVARNAPAGKYAHYIHDMKGVLWHKRGVGTQNKGSQADSLFILRAVQDNRNNIVLALHAALKKALNK